MIHANEIRIGNIYNRKHGKGWTQIVIDEFYMYKIFSPDKDYALDDFEPIELTPEILLSYGWILVNQGSGPYYWLEKQCWFHIHSFADNSLYANFNMNVVALKHLHQLQNLYRDLTGTELNYTP